MAFDRAKSLEELEDEVWGEPQYKSYLVVTCHHLRRKPLEEFIVEDLRILIGQNIGLRYLMPLALEHLRANPFVSGDYYGGDLLKSVLTVKCEFWQVNREMWMQTEEIIREIEIGKIPLESHMMAAIESFRSVKI
jgi:hypothetical protein